MAGGLGAATGGASFAAAGGAAMGGGGFLAGFAGGGIGTLFGSSVQSMGNTAFFNDPYPGIGDQLMTVGVGALTGGLINGGTAAYYGRNFWNGNVNLNLSYPSLSATGNIQQQSTKTGSAQMPRAKIDGLLDDGLPQQGRSLRILHKPEVPKLSTVSKNFQKNFSSHAKSFGISGNWNKANANQFAKALNSHVQSGGTKHIIGTYRNTIQVIHHVDPITGLNVMTTRSGQLISGWKLNPNQLRNVLNRGKL